MKFAKSATTLFFILCAMPICAQDWQMRAGSSLGFSSRFQGETFNGQFKRFNPQIRFDPKKLTQARFDVSIDLSSADTSNRERDDTLKTEDFFDIKKAQTARFTASTFKDLGKGRYLAKGQLSLRGIRKPVNLVFTWVPGIKPILRGEATINRLDFGIGKGDWADTDLLPNAVKVNTTLLLIAKPLTKP